MNQDSTDAAIMFEHSKDLKDYFLLLRSKQNHKNTFHVDINFYNMALKTKQPQNSIEHTQDGNASKFEAACWHFSQKKNIYLRMHTPGFFSPRSMKLWHFIPTSVSSRDRLVCAVHEHLRRSLIS